MKMLVSNRMNAKELAIDGMGMPVGQRRGEKAILAFLELSERVLEVIPIQFNVDFSLSSLASSLTFWRVELTFS